MLIKYQLTRIYSSVSSIDLALNNAQELRAQYLSWDRVFAEVLEYQKKIAQKLILIFDEIQWIAKDGSGFIGSLKAAWVRFELSQLIRIVVCGSSNKFFLDQVGGEEKSLRGIATRSPIWVHPIAPKEVAKKLAPKWSKIEIALTYMMFGGIPYYLQRIPTQFGFIHAINDAAFSADSIFLGEIEEILELDFNKAGMRTVKEILSVIKIHGASQSKIRKTLNLSSSTVSEMCEKLVDYNILFRELPIKSNQNTKGREIRYYIKDFYLNFYFEILIRFANRIKRNISGKEIIFSEILNRNGYFIENFSGKAFENFVQYLIETADLSSKLHKKLKLKSYDFDCFTFSSTETQVDIIVTSKSDRLVRVIECKWGKEISSELDELCNKSYPLESIQHRLNVLVKAQKQSAAYIKKAKSLEIVLISLDDLI